MQFLKRFLLWTLSKTKAYEQAKQKKGVKDLLFISFHEDGVYLNEVKIIDKKAELQFSVFKILVQHYMKEVFDGADYISMTKICATLKQSKIATDDIENQVRVSIYRIRNSANRLTKFKSDIITTSKWHGYRLSEHVFILRNGQV